MTRRRVFTDDEYALLTDKERATLAHLAVDAHTFEATFMLAAAGAFITGAIGAVADLEKMFVIGTICFISFIIIVWVGSDWHHRNFNRRLFEAIDRHKDES